MRNISAFRKTVKEKELTAVIVLNNTEDIFETCDKITILANGYVNQTASPREVYEKPATVAAAAALGRCNLIPS